ncbi:hypothetical protein PHJA_002386300 [Phtheirospermum japonicum]|uniref:Uncharacterized protein n=1 Tax=Phtheirospermum japonicum TaxID=374723 RepID=A0A830D2L5_9LAMI|nr:hypothetical protein PHJA_002386300 [Phtheirospermum japonicum]
MDIYTYRDTERANYSERIPSSSALSVSSSTRASRDLRHWPCERGFARDARVAVQIHRPSGRFQGLLNIATTVHYSLSYLILERVSTVSFRDVMEKNEHELRRLSSGGSKRGQKSSGGESHGFPNGTDSMTPSSSKASAALKEWNCVREIAGEIKGLKSDGGGLLCGMKTQMRISFCPSDLNFQFWVNLFGENA